MVDAVGVITVVDAAKTLPVDAVTTALVDGSATIVGLVSVLAIITGLLEMVVAVTMGIVLIIEVAAAGAVVEAKVVNIVTFFKSELPAVRAVVEEATTEGANKVVVVTVGLALRQDGE